MLDRIVAQAPVFLLIAVRCFALLMTLPLFSMRSVSRIAKIALAGYMAYIILPFADFSVYVPYITKDGSFDLIYIMLLIGEAMIGVIMGFYITIIFSAFSTAGQFFAFQMGLSASEVYDSMSQVENPLMGQYLNLVAMLIFMQNHWFQKLFLKGLVGSFTTMNVFKLLDAREKIVKFLAGGLTQLFADALVISLPILGTLMLVTVCMAILSRAAPQMNLLSEGFSIMLLVAFFIITVLMPSLCDFFERSFNSGITSLIQLFAAAGGKS
ncbi:MAG: flagellar biosynthetic protein FliR [Treponema sp.]|nr:flagellar biosynthetic protein FliR [Treponema sp.]